MEVKDSSPYLPKSKLKDIFSALKTSVAYRVWKRKLKQYGRFNENSNFKILEVGCGAGYFLRCIERWYPQAQIYGLDIEQALLDFALQRLKRARLIRQDGHTIPFQDESFDIISSFQVIEHLEDPGRFFSEANRLLKPQGLLLISTPNPAGFTAKALGGKWQGYRYDHISLKTPRQWRETLQESGFHILDDGTTLLSGYPVLMNFPFSMVNWIPLSLKGYFHWYRGESYMSLAQKV